MPRDQQPTRRQKETTATLVGLAQFVLIITVLWNVLKVGYEMVTHPTLHPRLYRALYELIHYHPTLLKYGWIILGIILISWRIYSISLARSSDKKRLKKAVPSRSEKNLELPESLSFAADAATTWANLTEAFPGLPIELDGLRVTHWRSLKNDQSRMQLTMSLSYDRIATGQASARPDPRVLNCVATVKGRGVSSNVLLSFVAEGMLDNRFTPAIIEETKAALKRVLDLQLKMSGPMDEFDRAIAAQEKKEALERQSFHDAEDESFRQRNDHTTVQNVDERLPLETQPEVVQEAASGIIPYKNFDGTTY